MKKIDFKNIIPYFLSILVILLMVAASKIFSQKEIIFPEVAALLAGALIMPKQMWRTNKAKLVLLPALCAGFGVLCVKFLPDIIYLQTTACFLFCALMLTLSKTDVVPAISASLLPVYFKVTSPVYPLSVAALALITVALQFVMEKQSLRALNIYEPINFNIKFEVEKWLKMLSVLFVISIIPYETGMLFFLAPPMVVAFVIFANPLAPVRQKAFNVWAAICIASILGTGALLIPYNGLAQLCLVLLVALILMFVILNKLKALFPPACAMALVPLLLPDEKLALFPLETAIGSAVLILAALLLFKKEPA